MKNIVHITIICLAASFTSCKDRSPETKNNSSARQLSETISVDEFEKKLSANSQLIDVRTPEEFGQGHLKEALNYDINAADFENQISKLDKNKPVLVYCLSGGRSASAAKRLAGKGFTEVYNMDGGILKWNASDKPLDNNNSKATSDGLSMEDFNRLVQSEKMVLIDYHAKWCEPCKKMAPVLNAFTDQRKDKLSFIKIDMDENKTLFKEKKITSIPFLELYKNGKLIWKHEGELDEATLIKETAL